MVYPCLRFCHYSSSTHLCIFVVFFVKLPAWVWSEQCIHTANTSSCAQGRCCRERGYKFKKLWRWNFDTQLSRTIVGYNEKWFNTTFFIPVCIFIASCTGVCSLWNSLTILALSYFFHRLSSPSSSLCFSLRIPCFFLHILYGTRVCMFYSALEFVYYLAHLSLCIIAYLFHKSHTHTHTHSPSVFVWCESVLDSVRMRARACMCTENPGISV